MELRIQPFPKNTYPKKGLLIKASSPLMWLQEMEILGIDLNEVQSYPVPSSELNILYGCFLIFKHHAPAEIGKNAYFQNVDDKLFIPENTVFYPKINPEDWKNIVADYIVMHPDFGLVKLNLEIDWLAVIQNPEISLDNVKKPSNGVENPSEIKSFMVEMDDEKVLEALQKPQTEEEWMKNLPFDMKKVMAGNKKEIEKYLKYIEKHPERAVELGVPLDIMGTSRGDGFSQYKFTSWFDKIFGGRSSSGADGSSKGSSSGNYRWIFYVVLIVFGIARIFFFLEKESSSEISENVHASDASIMEGAPTPPPPAIAYQSGVTDIDMKIDSMFGDKRNQLRKENSDAMMILMSSKREKRYEEYVKNGGRPVEKIQMEYLAIQKRIKTAEDSLRNVYKGKIDKFLVENETVLTGKITDSLRDAGSSKVYDKVFIAEIVERQQAPVRDSLSYRYGTKEYVPRAYAIPEEPSSIQTMEPLSLPKKSVSFTEIIGLILLITAVIFGYLFFVQRKPLDTGGENVPTGVKIFLMTVLLALLVYIFYPIIAMFGYNWFVWLLIIFVVLLLYRLFREDKTILKSDDDE
ncbi:hypothetical protein ASG31_12085 [Chryseobacterium sp. Leaf404]|uniref:hypothetical protein n=1 Tax=unclassified Chryseobacterium TaxID=2593645 RepID=UPI0006F51124|nr:MULTISPECIES: hypothetical protein [unclassified Chryseobacterium]KQT17083.1 hypothetical protein ASG31_12085 [Chryseobacterium sp. Leaf404]